MDSKRVWEFDSTCERLRALVYGPSGTFKTMSLRTIPASMTVKVVDFDNGAVGIRNAKGFTIKTFIDPPAIPLGIPGLTQTEKPSAWIKGRSEILMSLLKPDCDILVVDTLSMMTQAMVRHILGEKGKDSYRPVGNEWWDIASEVQSVFPQFMNPRIHVIMLAHEEMVKNENDAVIGVRPLTIGKFVNQIGNYFSEVYHTVKRGNTYYWDMKGTSNTIAKSRYYVSGEVSEIPQDWTKVFDTLKKKFNGAVP